jgi:hypothetical protein
MSGEPMSLACVHVLERGKFIAFASHQRDGGWRLLCSRRHKEKELRPVDPELTIQKDDELSLLIDMPVGLVARRDSKFAMWVFAAVVPGKDGRADEEVPLPAELRVKLCGLMLSAYPDDAKLWSDLAETHMELRDWRACADACLRSLALHSESRLWTWWMLGIAATALRDWDLARKAWRGWGKTVDDGPGPIRTRRYDALIRLPNLEVLWTEGIDYARAIITNVPTPQSGFRWGDIVLHDSEKRGERVERGVVVPIFECLERWSVSELPTLRVKARCGAEEDARELSKMFRDKSFIAEDWSRMYFVEGSFSGEHRPLPDFTDERTFGIACQLDLTTELLATWQRQSPSSRSFEPPEEVG